MSRVEECNPERNLSFSLNEKKWNWFLLFDFWLNKNSNAIILNFKFHDCRKRNDHLGTRIKNAFTLKLVKIIVYNSRISFSKADEKKQETLHVVIIVMTYSTLASLWKFQHFRRPIYNQTEHLWWSFYSKPLSIFTKKIHRRCSLGFYIRLCFVETVQTFYFFKVFYIIRLLKRVISLKYFTSFNSSNKLLKVTSAATKLFFIIK